MSTIQNRRDAIRSVRPNHDATPIRPGEKSKAQLTEAQLEATRDRMMQRPLITNCFPRLPAKLDERAASELGVAMKDMAAQQQVRRGLSAAGAALGTSAQEAAATAATSPASRASSTQVVVPGDTLSGIAMQHGVPLDQVIAANPQIANPDLIYPGDVVNIPGGTAAPDSSAPDTSSGSPPIAAPSTMPSGAPSDGLPTSAAEANRAHLTQFYDPTYNPTGPLSSTNCGPASLAMTLDTIGKMPPGLTPEQRVDYARSLMNPGAAPTGYVTASDGQSVPQLDTDSALSNVGQLETAASSLGVPTSQGSGWDELDATLASGKPVVANGNTNDAWRAQFPHGDGARYGSGDIGHFNTILGKTPDGKYIVSDPMYTGGPVEMTREQLAVFFGPAYGGVPHFLSVG